ncbi:MAG: preprotein translocase subunit SecE [Nitriliruptorales bacterium]|nr:preprotein translocase subunit SecE [Nitriliruptorales bacterium]
MNREEERAADREERRSERAGASRGDESAKRERTSPAQFLREVRSELSKVAWPHRKEIVNYTVVVLAVTTFLTLLVFGMDWVLKNAITNLF